MAAVRYGLPTSQSLNKALPHTEDALPLSRDAGYNFILTVIDGQAPGGGGVDKFRIKIWNKTTGAIVFDSQMGQQRCG